MNMHIASNATPPIVQAIPLGELTESPTNPRKSFGDLSDLAASIRQKGILEPLLARPAPGGEKGGGYELVFGHRRFRAAALAGLESVPVMVRDLDDKEALEAQIIENGQRKDVTALEEADGYTQLHEKFGYSVDEIAAKTAKSRAYVYARMKLAELCDDARKALAEGKITAATALLVARMPSKKLQKEALEEITPYDDDDDAMSARAAYRTLKSGRFVLTLAKAPFDTSDAQLVADAGHVLPPRRTKWNG